MSGPLSSENGDSVLSVRHPAPGAPPAPWRTTLQVRQLRRATRHNINDIGLKIVNYQSQLN